MHMNKIHSFLIGIFLPAAFITAGRILKETGVPDDVTIYFTGTVLEEDCDGLCWNTAGSI